MEAQIAKMCRTLTRKPTHLRKVLLFFGQTVQRNHVAFAKVQFSTTGNRRHPRDSLQQGFVV
jgi:hypothetical protein